MANKTVYGVDMTKKVTPIMVRDAIIDCFIMAHKDILKSMKEFSEFKSEKEFKEMKKINIKFFIENTFSKVGGDFNNPDKRSLLKVVDSLKEYAAYFRKKGVIEEHAGEIIKLIDKLEAQE